MPLLPHPVAARVCAPLWSFFAALVLGPFLTDVVAPHQKVFAVFGLLPCALLPFGGITCSCEGAGTSETPASSNEYYEYAPPSRSYLGGDEGSLGEAATDQLANECLPEGGLESSGAQVAPIFLIPEG